MQDSPLVVFQRAQAAMERRAYAEFFACLDPSGLSVIAQNGIGWLLTRPELHAEPAVASLPLADLNQQIAAMDASAKHVLAMRTSDPATANQASLQHRDLVKTYQASIKRAAKAATLPAVLGWIESQRRAADQGGSIATTLFIGETLENCIVTETTATAVRRRANGTTEPIRFALTRGTWKIKLF